MRARFLKYSKTDLHNFRVFLAEDANKDLTLYGVNEFLNIADFENLLADISDCIIIFPESPGSIAELAYFTNSKAAIKKLLVINDVTIQNDSFINKGLIDKINSRSLFRPIILMSFHIPRFHQIKQRLEDRLTKTSKRFEYQEDFYRLTVVQKLFIIFQIIYLFRAIQYEGILQCLTAIFRINQDKQLKHILSILIASKYVERKGDDHDYFVPSVKAEPFLEFRNYDIEQFRIKVTDFYERNYPEIFSIIKG